MISAECADVSASPLSRISNEFVCPDRETAFLAEKLPETLKHAKSLLVFSAVLNTLFLVSDWRFFGQDHFWIAVPARLAVIGISLACWPLLTRAKDFRRAQIVMLSWEAVSAIAISLLVSSRSDLALFVVLLLPTIFYLIVPTSFRWTLIAGSACSVLLLAGYILPAPLRDTNAGLIVAVLTLNVSLALFVMRSNRLQRLEWAATQAAQKSTEDLRSAVEAAELANEAKTQFLAGMSHEIRTPLHGITGLTALILSRDDLDPDIRRQVRLIDISSAALLTVVNDVLDFSKIEAGAIQLDPMPLWPRAMIKQCAEIVRSQAEAKGLSLTVHVSPDDPARVIGDEPRLRQVLLNLLVNAIKFTPTGSVAVSLKQESGKNGKDRLVISVSDTGIGIPKAKRDRLFQRFSQIDSSTSRQFGGTGLGLAISKQLIELMGGTIGVDTEVGRGSTFWFEVDLARDEVQASTDQVDVVPRQATARGVRILLAEDLEINQEIARAMLEASGYQVDVVSDGAEAFRAVQDGAFDVVLMDVQMPVMDGVSATQHIRSLPGPSRDVPVIAMTANVYAEQVEEFRQAGMDDHIGKPFRRDELLEVVDRWVQNHPRGKSFEVPGPDIRKRQAAARS